MRLTKAILILAVLAWAGTANSAQVTVYAQNATMNWSDSGAWNTTAGSGGTVVTNPQNGGGTTYVCDTNGKAVTLDVASITVDKITEAGVGTLVIPTSGSVTLSVSASQGLYYGPSGTYVTISADKSLTINGQVYSNTTRALYQTGGTLSITNSGLTALTTPNGAGAAFTQSGGSATITGNVACNYKAIALSGGTLTFIGDILQTANNDNVVYITGAAVLNLQGVPLMTGLGRAPTYAPLTINSSTATLNWSGSYSVSSGSVASILVYNTSTINTSGLLLSNSGKVMLFGATNGSANGSIVNSTSAAQSVVTWVNGPPITGPTIPAATRVQSGTSYGYSGSPQTGSLYIRRNP